MIHSFVSTSKTLFVVLTIVAFSTSAANSQELDPRLSNFDISGQVRFQNRKEAEERRDMLVRFIWKQGLPATRPAVTELKTPPDELAAIKQTLIARVHLYDVNVSSMDFHSLVYVIHPTATQSTSARLAIVHAGHMPEGLEHALDAGLKQTVERLLENGFVVAMMQMPLVSWNKDASGILPNGTAFEIKKRGSAGHDELFKTVEPIIAGQTMAFFLEPIVQVTNELLARHPNNSGLLMIGLSGGGWTTHCSAALDSRIICSIPVAGALPLYARPFSRGSKGDAEQEYAPIFLEVDSNNDGILDKAAGVCSWLEVFGLGAISPTDKLPRHQTQVINFDDSCCFSGPVYQTYNESLAKRVSVVGAGKWQVYVDRSHREHLISDKVLDEVLMPAIRQMTTQP